MTFDDMIFREEVIVLMIMIKKEIQWMIDIVNQTLTEGLLYYVGQFTISTQLSDYLFIFIKLLYYTDNFTISIFYFIFIYRNRPKINLVLTLKLRVLTNQSLL